MGKITKEETKDGIHAQTTNRERARIDKKKAKALRESPNTKNMKRVNADRRTLIFASTVERAERIKNNLNPEQIV